jgi:hypothetical protein
MLKKKQEEDEPDWRTSNTKSLLPKWLIPVKLLLK